jgi:hypothetical protein
MDLALAHAVAAKLAHAGHALDAWQMRSLWHSARAAKERSAAARWRASRSSSSGSADRQLARAAHARRVESRSG